MYSPEPDCLVRKAVIRKLISRTQYCNLFRLKTSCRFFKVYHLYERLALTDDRSVAKTVGRLLFILFFLFIFVLGILYKS